jgi:hypothetical protein
MESLIYVIMEPSFRTHAAVSGTVATYERNKDTPTAPSVESRRIRRRYRAVKRVMVENPSSNCTRRMPAPAARSCFKVLQDVQSLKCKGPMYAADVANALANLTIPVTATAASKKRRLLCQARRSCIGCLQERRLLLLFSKSRPSCQARRSGLQEKGGSGSCSSKAY